MEDGTYKTPQIKGEPPQAIPRASVPGGSFYVVPLQKSTDDRDLVTTIIRHRAFRHQWSVHNADGHAPRQPGRLHADGHALRQPGRLLLGAAQASFHFSRIPRVTFLTPKNTPQNATSKMSSKLHPWCQKGCQNGAKIDTKTAVFATL